MKTLLTLPFRKYVPAAFAALSLAALPLASQAKDKDDDDHPKGKEKHVEKKHAEPEKKHEDSRTMHKEDAPVRHKDDAVVHHKDDAVVHHKDDAVVHHKGDPVVHKDDVVVHRKGDPVVHEERGRPDHVVHHDDRVVRRDDRPGDRVVVEHHRHPGYVLHLADGWRGRGYYYGPPNVRYFDETPGVVYFSTREAAPAEYVDDAPVESREMAVQRALSEKGYYDGAVDGELGPMSRRAIARYKGEHGMRPDGEITDALLHSLGIN